MTNVLKYQGCLIGQCLGDALGFPVEGYEPNECRQYVNDYINKKPEVMKQRATFPFGQYTDDSQLARELIQSFIELNGSFDPSRPLPQPLFEVGPAGPTRAAVVITG